MIQTTIGKIQELQKTFYEQTTAPLDDYYVFGVIASGDVYRFDDGYCIVKDHELLQFYHKTFSRTLFSAVIKQFNINKLIASTYDGQYYDLCQEFGSNREVISIFFEDTASVDLSVDIDCKIIKATSTMMNHVMKYTKSAMGESGDHVIKFYEHLIETDALYLVMKGNLLIGTGEMRPSKLNEGYANLGMTVDNNYRGKGLGRYILNEMKKIAYEKGYKPLCGTDIENTASKKAIESCGFTRYQSVFKFYI